MKLISRTILCLAAFAGIAANLCAQEKPTSFRTAIDLALKNSTSSAMGAADLERARQNYKQGRDLFLPQVTVGAGLAYSYGFPLSLEGSAPSLVNVNIQSFLFNQAQRDYIRAAKSDMGAATASNADRRNDVIMETALCYIQLDRLQTSLTSLREQQDLARKFEDIVSQRVQAGLDSPVEATRAKLATARARLHLLDAQASADQLRQRLAQLTGVPSILTSTETIPALPAVVQDGDLAKASANNPAVRVAEETARAKEFRARAEHKQLYPAVDFVSQFSELARYNNYDVFFRHYQAHNVTVGASIRFPIFNFAQRAAAAVADAEAEKARKEAQSVKDQVSADTLKLQRSVEQLSAVRDVTKLEYELAQAEIDAAQARIASGAATLKDEQTARIAEHERYTVFLDSALQLERAQIQLLRQTGDLEAWALGATSK
ncbi:MAG TPA: TolC family protein [Alphaproteobacteria bacterium]|nr:TolC family protein [Alphaproteobacteria bacterium]